MKNMGCPDILKQFEVKVTIIILYMKNKVLPVIESRTRCAELPLGKIFMKKFLSSRRLVSKQYFWRRPFLWCKVRAFLCTQ